MKKTIFAIVLVLGLLIALSTTVIANGGPHGGFTATTAACAGCHRAHTAPAPGLVLSSSTYSLCISCHGTTGTGADSNVLDGVWVEGRNPTDTTGDANTALNGALNAGGFTNYKGAAATSSHSATGATVNSWGTTTRGVAGTAMALDCASCHDPHGNTNYRIIPTTINGVTVTVAQVDEGAAKDYDNENWGTGQSSMCAACHSAYHKTAANQGSTLDGGSYTHRIDMAYTYGTNVNPETLGYGGFNLPLAGTNVVCQTCHLPHGTSAQMTGWAAGTYDPDGTGPLLPVPSGDSALLRLDNRGVCEVCHQK